jgi:hypothetical protein
MKCDEARNTLPLFLYGELSFEEEERLELHLDACGVCREALAKEKSLHAMVDRGEWAPSPELLADCRHELRRRMANAPPRENGWERWRRIFSVRFHPMPGALQPFGALALVALGFAGAQMVRFNGTELSPAGVLNEPVASRVRYVEPMATGRVQIVIDETRQRTLSGSLEDQSIQKLLLSAAKDSGDAGLRVESVDLLKNRTESVEVRRALLYAVEHDPNPGVRLKALDGLKGFASDPETRKALSRVLLSDKNPGVRTQAIDLLIQHKGDATVGVLQEVMRQEDNGYIRMRCQRALRDLNASVETF